MKKAVFFVGFAAITGLLSLRAETTPVARPYMGEIIDTPTADLIDHYGYNVNFRFGKEGNLQSKATFGVFPHLNLGFGLDAEKVLGTQNARMNSPTLNVKFQLFDGRKNLPMLALGFDGQGYQFNKTTDEYDQREKGLYLVATKEVLFPGFMLNLGGNMYDFNENDTVRGFLGCTYMYENTVGLLFEWDNATFYPERRLNYGAKYFVTPAFSVDFAFRNIPEAPGSDSRVTERILRLNYTGSF